MPFSTNGRNEMLDGLTVSHVSAHEADPGDAGANEVSGGSYARQTITFGPAAGGLREATNSPVIPIPAGTTVTHLGLWDALTVGNFKGDADIADEAFGSAGNLTVTSFSLSLT